MYGYLRSVSKAEEERHAMVWGATTTVCVCARARVCVCVCVCVPYLCHPSEIVGNWNRLLLIFSLLTPLPTLPGQKSFILPLLQDWPRTWPTSRITVKAKALAGHCRKRGTTRQNIWNCAPDFQLTPHQPAHILLVKTFKLIITRCMPWHSHLKTSAVNVHTSSDEANDGSDEHYRAVLC